MFSWKNILIISLILAAAVTTFLFTKSYFDNKKLKEEMTKIEAKIDESKKQASQLEVIIDDLTNSVADKEVAIEKLEKSQQEAHNEAKSYKDQYYKLKNKKPITIKDSLEVSEEMVEVLVSENTALTETVKICDSVKGIQYETITDLKTIILRQGELIRHKDDIIELQDLEISKYRKEIKKKKFSSFLKGMGTGGVIIGVLIILAL